MTAANLPRSQIPMDDNYKRGYSRGYQLGGKRWPDHKPPVPPDEVMGPIVKALKELRDAIDGELAPFDADDPLNVALSPAIDSATSALSGLSTWLKESS